jgi:hypothetical protein
MSVDAAIPDRFWPAVRWACTYVFSWILPLIAAEEFVAGRMPTGIIVALLTLLVWIIAAKWDPIEKAIAEGRRGVALGVIAVSAIGLAIGIILLALSSRTVPLSPTETAAPAPVIPAPNLSDEIPGIPTTKAGLSRGLDAILPELSDLINVDGIRIRNSIADLATETPDLLVNSSRQAATTKVTAAVTNLKRFSQDIRTFKNKYSLDGRWINWVIGEDDNFFQQIINSIDRFNQVFNQITLPPAYSPPMLLEFWRGGQTTVDASDQIANFANWLSNVRVRIQGAHDQFEKKLSANSP